MPSSLVNVRSLQLECVSALHKALLAPALFHGRETVVWKEERSRIRAVQMDPRCV